MGFLIGSYWLFKEVLFFVIVECKVVNFMLCDINLYLFGVEWVFFVEFLFCFIWNYFFLFFVVVFNIYVMIFLKWVRFVFVVLFFLVSILIGVIGMYVIIGEGFV